MATPQIFVSHSHTDNEYCRVFVAALRELLSDSGTVWYDEHNLGWGALRQAIDRELQQRQHFIAILSPAAVTSEWVNTEIDAALSLLRKGSMRTIQFVTAVPCDVPPTLERYKRIEQAGGLPYSPAEAAIRAYRVITEIASKHVLQSMPPRDAPPLPILQQTSSVLTSAAGPAMQPSVNAPVPLPSAPAARTVAISDVPVYSSVKNLAKGSLLRIELLFSAIMAAIMLIIASVFVWYGQIPGAVPLGVYEAMYGWLPNGDETGGPLFNPFSALGAFIVLAALSFVVGRTVTKRSGNVSAGQQAGFYFGLISGVLYTLIDRLVRAITVLFYSNSWSDATIVNQNDLVGILLLAILLGSITGLGVGTWGSKAVPLSGRLGSYSKQSPDIIYPLRIGLVVSGILNFIFTVLSLSFYFPFPMIVILSLLGSGFAGFYAYRRPGGTRDGRLAGMWTGAYVASWLTLSSSRVIFGYGVRYSAFPGVSPIVKLCILAVLFCVLGLGAGALGNLARRWYMGQQSTNVPFQ